MFHRLYNTVSCFTFRSTNYLVNEYITQTHKLSISTKRKYAISMLHLQ